MANNLAKVARELRIHLCQKSPGSKGVREWIEQKYVPLKKANPGFPILIRECSNVEPKIYARYGNGKENCVNLTNKGVADVTKAVEMLVKPINN